MTTFPYPFHFFPSSSLNSLIHSGKKISHQLPAAFRQVSCRSFFLSCRGFPLTASLLIVRSYSQHYGPSISAFILIVVACCWH